MKVRLKLPLRPSSALERCRPGLELLAAISVGLLTPKLQACRRLCEWDLRSWLWLKGLRALALIIGGWRCALRMEMCSEDGGVLMINWCFSAIICHHRFSSSFGFSLQGYYLTSILWNQLPSCLYNSILLDWVLPLGLLPGSSILSIDITNFTVSGVSLSSLVSSLDIYHVLRTHS